MRALRAVGFAALLLLAGSGVGWWILHLAIYSQTGSFWP